MYFKHYIAWRTAFFDMLELEHSDEVACKGCENRTGLRYVPYTQPTTQISNEQQPDPDPATITAES